MHATIRARATQALRDIAESEVMVSGRLLGDSDEGLAISKTLQPGDKQSVVSATGNVPAGCEMKLLGKWPKTRGVTGCGDELENLIELSGVIHSRAYVHSNDSLTAAAQVAPFVHVLQTF